MRTGVQLVLQGHDGYSDREMYQEELRLAIEAEEMGYDTLWVVEHHFFDYAMCPDNMQYLSYVAARTENLELATSAIILPWNNPVRAVEKMILLDHLSNGRAILGIGRGLAQREYRAFGVDMAEARERFDEAAEIILRGLETGFVEADTKYYKQDRVEVRPRPFKTFAGRRYMVCMSPESFGIAASLGLGAMMFSQMPWELVADRVWGYRDDFRRLNGGAEAPPIFIADFVVCHPDAEEAEALARAHLSGYFLSLAEHYEFMDVSHFEKTGSSYRYYAQFAEQMMAAGQEAVVEGFLNANLFGDPDTILDKLRKRREIIGDFELNAVFSFQSLPYDYVERAMRLFAREVAPEVKAWEPSTHNIQKAEPATAAAAG